MLLNRPKYAETLEFLVITDLTSPGVFDEAVKGVDAIIHTASVRPPTFFNLINLMTKAPSHPSLLPLTSQTMNESSCCLR